MVHICVVCKSKSNTNEELSFHLFPKDDRRGAWMQAFGLTEVSNWHSVCSKHFDEEHFISSGGQMILLRDAVPLASKNATATTSLNSPLSQTLEHNNDTFMEDSPVNAKRKLFDSISPLAKKNSKSSNSTRFGDLSINDFSSPNRARRNFPVVQSTISGLRSKTKNLMEKNRRLQT
ncbi:uncharacterized protein LOC111030968 [Myzus persicae]|uniref:uncharacterized protein LOC111027057 n=1 Tax=Myzus persicae TaxID=13164 RepID=UPI000B935351|nr:uncharacterized protein LOC111027057 [Myzus persicae]XP_022166417.1 uncharacterized protein LOC111030968 [Myzus persicae]